MARLTAVLLFSDLLKIGLIGLLIGCPAWAGDLPEGFPSGQPSPVPMQTPKNLSTVRQQTLSRLLEKKYFRNATCGQIADSLLTANGLPPLLASEPVRGRRGDFDRSGEKNDPPEFSDEITRREKPLEFSKITASGNAENWILGLKRGTGKLTTITRFRFKTLEKINVKSCELVDIGFSAREEGISKSFSKTMNLDHCLDLFIVGAPPPSDLQTAPEPLTVEKYLKLDCATGTHYSLEGETRALRSHR